MIEAIKEAIAHGRAVGRARREALSAGTRWIREASDAANGRALWERADELAVEYNEALARYRELQARP